VHLHAHSHDGRLHLHPHVHAQAHLRGGETATDDHHHHAVSGGRKPFLVGVAHGLAGSAALMLAILATIPDRNLAIAYVVVFALGSIGAMVVMSLVMALPVIVSANRWTRGYGAFQRCAGVASVTLGCVLVWQLGGEATSLLRAAW
jgi:hypothetical protein